VAEPTLGRAGTSVLDRLDSLDSAVVSDSLDRLGYRKQVMAPRIRALWPEARSVGYASTVLALPTSEEVTGGGGDSARRDNGYGPYFAAIEALGPGDVMVVSTIGNCFWGELVSVAARSQGARGVVIDGFTRDSRTIISMGFPTFVAGVHVADVLGRVEVVDLGGEIEAGGVKLQQRDLVIADRDGVVVIPTGVAQDAIALAEKMLRDEDIIRAKLGEGMSTSAAFRVAGYI
jgi:regulator of RNase E activity RraA